MMQTALVLAAFSAGLLGSPHCLGMCGGIVAAFNMTMPSQQRLKFSSLYHLGRLSSYALLGLLFGILGTGMYSMLKGNPWPSILLGLLFIILGCSMLGIAGFTLLEQAGGKAWQALAPLRKRILPINTTPKAYIAGILWGLLPCGLVYTSLALAMSSGNAVDSALLMLAFGVGTLPMLIGSQQILTPLQQWLGKWKIRSVMGGVWVLVGVWTLAMPVMHMLNPHSMHHGMHAMPTEAMPPTTQSSSPTAQSHTAGVSAEANAQEYFEHHHHHHHHHHAH